VRLELLAMTCREITFSEGTRGYDGCMSYKLRLFMDWTLLATGALLCGFLLLTASLGSREPETGRPVLVVAPPWGDGASAAVRAGGGVEVGPVRAPFATLAVFESRGFVPRVIQAGAWTVRDAGGLSVFCGVDES
jgi:hypothetical protein